MKKDEILLKLNTLKLVNILNFALSLVNKKREMDTSNATVAFDLRDKIKRAGRLHGLNIDFDGHNKLILKTAFGIFEITSYNNKKLEATRNDEPQLSLFQDENKDNICAGSICKIAFITNKSRKKYAEVALIYKSTNGSSYYNSLLINKEKTSQSVPETLEHTSIFIKPKKPKREDTKKAN